MDDKFANRIAGAFGRDGKDWLNCLPEIIEGACERWSLTLSPPYQPLSYNYVCPAVDKDQNPVVLKLGVPRHELTTEIAALRHFDGDGMVRLIDASSSDGLLLLERIEPGERLAESADELYAVDAFAMVVTKMKMEPTKDKVFPHVSDWAKGFDRYRTTYDNNIGPIPEGTIEKAETIINELLDSSTNEVLLHGDLHHFNILSSGDDQWKGIDPKGVTGELEYEASAFLRNPFNRVLRIPSDVFERRIDQLCERLQFDRERVLGWAFAQTVLSAVWSLEDNDDWQADLACAERFERLR